MVDNSSNTCIIEHMNTKLNAMASTISHSEDCILEVQDWLEDQNNPDNEEVLAAIQQALNILAGVYHNLREDNG